MAHSDWLVASRSWCVLHSVPAAGRCPFDERMMVYHGGDAACGIETTWAIPGLGSRLALPRCKRCCRVLGIEPGNGTPENEAWIEKQNAKQGGLTP